MRELYREGELYIHREALGGIISMAPVNDPMYQRQLENVWNKAKAALRGGRE